MEPLLKKELILIGCLLICIHFSGCTEPTDNRNLEEKIILVDENIVIPPVAGGESVVYYRGTIKNTADVTIDTVTVIVHFYDKENNSIGSKEDSIKDLKANHEKNFQVAVSEHDDFYFQIDHISYEFKV
jgi:hypothetical protein